VKTVRDQRGDQDGAGGRAAGATTPTVHRVSAHPLPLRTRLAELLASRDLFLILLGRELRVRYKQTALGVAWVILQPLVPAIILAVVFGAFAKLPSDGIPYLLFALSGLILYGLFSSTVSRAGGSLVRDGALVTKIYFPRELLPIAAGTAGIVDFLVGLAVLVAATLLMGQPVDVRIVVLPLTALLTLVLALGLGMAVAALGARYRDVMLIVPFVLQLLLYASPVLYSLQILPERLVTVLAINPLVPLIGAFRWSLLGTPPPTPDQIVLGAISGTVMAVAGVAVFSRASRDLADVV
jgi:lipopolysaccharide transport system permease protein